MQKEVMTLKKSGREVLRKFYKWVFLLLINFLFVTCCFSWGEWKIQTVESETDIDDGVSIALDSNDYPHISFFDVAGAYPNLVYYLKHTQWNGINWSTSIVDLGQNWTGSNSSLDIDSSNNSHISYHEQSPTGKLKYAEWTGVVWSTSTIDAMNNSGKNSSIVFDPVSECPGIAYLRSEIVGGPPFYSYSYLKYAQWNGGSWDLSVVDSRLQDPDGNKLGQNCSVALDSDNYPQIAYYDGGYTVSNLKYAQWNGVSWSTATVDSWATTTSDSKAYSCIALDANNYPHISYYNEADEDLKYARWTGTEWSIKTVDSSDEVGKYTSIALDSNDYPHITYYDETNDDLKYARWTGPEWSIETVDSSGEVGTYTSLLLDALDRPHIAYLDVSNKDLKYATLDNTPVLSWSGEANYQTDGLHPESATTATTIIYRVKYTDLDNEAPASGYPKVHIKKGGVEITGSPFIMSYVSGNYNTGTIYTYTTTLALGTDYTYYFEARALNDVLAIGEATNSKQGPLVTEGAGEGEGAGEVPIEVGGVMIQGGDKGYISLAKEEEARIHFHAENAGEINIRVYTLKGQLVCEKSKETTGNADFILWDGKNSDGTVVSSGVYVIYINGPGIDISKKIAILK